MCLVDEASVHIAPGPSIRSSHSAVDVNDNKNINTMSRQLLKLVLFSISYGTRGVHFSGYRADIDRSLFSLNFQVENSTDSQDSNAKVFARR